MQEFEDPLKFIASIREEGLLVILLLPCSNRIEISACVWPALISLFPAAAYSAFSLSLLVYRSLVLLASYFCFKFLLAERYGICKIVPPAAWQPVCQLDELTFRFPVRLQRLHQLYRRTGPCTMFLECLQEHLQSEKVEMHEVPTFAGIELDLYNVSDLYVTGEVTRGLE